AGRCNDEVRGCEEEEPSQKKRYRATFVSMLGGRTEGAHSSKWCMSRQERRTPWLDLVRSFRIVPLFALQSDSESNAERPQGLRVCSTSLSAPQWGRHNIAWSVSPQDLTTS